MHTRARGLILAGLVGMAFLVALMGPASRATAESKVTRVETTTEANGLGGPWLPSVHDGLNGVVFTVASMGGELYVGGKFTATKDESVQGLNHIAKFSNGQWTALPNGGLDGLFVRDLVAVGDELFVAGVFSE